MARVRTFGRRTRMGIFFIILSMLAVVVAFSLFDTSTVIVAVKNFVKGVYSFFSGLFSK